MTGLADMSACIFLNDSQRASLSSNIQGVSRGKVNVFGGDSISRGKKS